MSHRVGRGFFDFIYYAASFCDASQSSSIFTTSLISQSRSVTPAAIAGVTRSVFRRADWSDSELCGSISILIGILPLQL
jgi:hypothetical protein